MIKNSLLAIGLLFSINVLAQTGIGTASPHPSAKLEVASDRLGFLPPRIALTSTNSSSPINSPATGLVIFNTATAGTSPNNVLPGYYYWDGTKWNGLVDQGALNSFSGFVPNFAQSNASSVTRGSVGDIILSQSITTSGRPIQIIATGDANPQGNGAWVQIQLFRDGVAIGKKVQAESSASNENVPYCLNFIDTPTAGTYTYSVRVTAIGGASFQFGEADGNQLTLIELGAWSAGTMPVSKGGTGNSSYTAGSLIFSDGSSLAQNNARLFWDNSNNRLGIGNNTPAATLDISGSLGVNGTTTFRTAGGDEGGEIEFGVPQTNTTLSSRVVADVWQNRFRVFDGNTRGVHIDLSKAPVGVAGELIWKSSGIVNVGTFVQLDNIKAAVTRTGAGGGLAGLSIGAVSTTFVADLSATYSNNSMGGSTATGVTYTTAASNSAFGWGFTQGNQSTYLLNDTTNNRIYRITLMIGANYNNNFISIERLF